MKIKIESSELIIEDRVGADGPYQTRKQRASVENGTMYPLEFLVSVPKGAPAYLAGEYEVLTPFAVDAYGNLSLGKYMKLRAVPAASKVAPVRATA